MLKRPGKNTKTKGDSAAPDNLHIVNDSQYEQCTHTRVESQVLFLRCVFVKVIT